MSNLAFGILAFFVVTGVVCCGFAQHYRNKEVKAGKVVITDSDRKGMCLLGMALCAVAYFALKPFIVANF
jgi:hypothetical protein